MYNYQYILTCNFQLIPNSFKEVADKLEITLPCINCQRFNRTIIFEDEDHKGICTPRQKCKGFPGKLITREINQKMYSIEVKYTIDFDYKSFTDKKYKTEAESIFKFGWARVSFSIKCSKCSRTNTISTQENIGRPWDVKCDCGNIIYKDDKSPFKYEVREKTKHNNP